MRVLLLNQTFHPDIAATAQHAHDLARHLVAAGHEVVVVTSRSTYGSAGATLAKREIVDGAEVHRVGFSLFGKGGTLSRAVDFGIFYLAATARLLAVKRVDVVVPFTTPPLIVGAAWLNRRLRGTPYVYWVMDLYPDLAAALGVMPAGGLAHRVFERLSRRFLRGAARVVVLGRCMRDRVAAKGIDPAKLVHIGVWADKGEVAPRAESEREENRKRVAWGLTGKLAVMYSGNLGLGHDTEAMCDAMRRLRDRADVRFVFVGGGKGLAAVKAFAEREGLANVRFEPYQPREELGESLTAGDVHLISQKAELTGMLVPSKLFGVMAAGRPVVFVGSEEAEAARVVAESRCGAAVREGDGAALAAAIERYAADPAERIAAGERGRAALEERYDRSIACAAWERVLREVAEEARTRR